MSTTRYGVVVGIDGSSGGNQAMEWAAAEAVRRRTRLTVLCAYEVTTVPYVDGYGLGPAAMRAEADAVIEKAMRRLSEKRQVRPGTVPDADDIDVEVIEGSPGGMLVERSAMADLVVVGRRGLNVLDRLVLGSVSSAVSAMARGAVAVVPIDPVALESDSPDDAVGPVSRVVAAVDFDDHLDRVLEVAFDEARHAGVPLVAVHALTQDFVAGPYAAAGAWVHQYQDEALASLHDEMRRWAEKYPSVEWTVEVAHGSSAEVLVSRLDRHDLAVVGGRRHTPIAGRIMRSVADRLARTVPCPVIVAHG